MDYLGETHDMINSWAAIGALVGKTVVSTTASCGEISHTRVQSAVRSTTHAYSPQRDLPHT
eukprot:1225574-Pyramimonas_sp.AAC.1